MIRPLIDEHFPEVSENHAAALIGWGSDVLGNDDEWSKDHEWGPRCILFLPESLEHCKNALYNMLNAKIPPKIMGYPTRFAVNKDTHIRVLSEEDFSSVSIDITTVKKFFRENLGLVTPQSDLDWLSIPENRLLEVTGGEVFFDGVGELTELREFYQGYYPQNVWKYRLAFMWQALGWDVDLIGLCHARGDFLSERHCLSMTLFRMMKLTFLLNRRYAPSYPKWLGREFYKLPKLAKKIGPILESCYLDEDIESVISKLEEVSRELIRYQNTLDGLPRALIKSNPFCRGFWKIDFQYIANQIYKTIDGPLKTLDLDGAVDQWICNEDFFMDCEKLRRLSSVYRPKD